MLVTTEVAVYTILATELLPIVVRLVGCLLEPHRYQLGWNVANAATPYLYMKRVYLGYR